VFPPYTADQLFTILKQRAERAFHAGVVDDDVISYCAALAAREHGDARRALDLLRIAGEIAERENANKVSIEHVKKALLEMEEGRVFHSIIALPLQQKLVLKSIVDIVAKKESTTTGEVYSNYVEEARKHGLEPLSIRSVSYIISQLDMMGIIIAEVKSLGRHGLTKVIRVKDEVVKIVKEALREFD